MDILTISLYGDIKPLQTLNIISYAFVSDNPHETYSIELKNTNNEE